MFKIRQYKFFVKNNKNLDFFIIYVKTVLLK